MTFQRLFNLSNTFGEEVSIVWVGRKYRGLKIHCSIRELNLRHPDLPRALAFSVFMATCLVCRRFEPRTSTNACGHICKYVDRKSLAAMLTCIQLVGVAPEVNLRIIQVRTHAKRDPSWLWNPGRHHLKSKKGVLVSPRKGLVSSKFFFKKVCSKQGIKENALFFNQHERANQIFRRKQQYRFAEYFFRNNSILCKQILTKDCSLKKAYLS